MTDYSTPIRLRWWQAMIASILCVLLTGCEPAKPESYGAGITGYNFTSEGVQEFYVNGQYASNLPPYGGGGGVVCCINVPATWRPGLIAKIDWTVGRWTTPYESRKHLSDDEQIKCCTAHRTLSKTVPIEPYGPEGGDFQVFFLPNDDVKVWITMYGLGHAKHPSGMSYPKNPNPSPKG